jgi:hypothetical protein
MEPVVSKPPGTVAGLSLWAAAFPGRTAAGPQPRQPRSATPEAVFAWVAWFGSWVTRRRVMTQAQLADTLAGCVNQQINQELPGTITGIRDHLRGQAVSRCAQIGRR